MLIDQITKIIKDYVDTDIEITEETSLRGDLGMSSLDLINLAVEVEDEYNIQLPDKELNSIDSIKDLVLYIEMRKK